MRHIVVLATALMAALAFVGLSTTGAAAASPTGKDTPSPAWISAERTTIVVAQQASPLRLKW